MSENVYKKPENPNNTDKVKAPGVLHGLLDGSILQGNRFVSLLPFLFFITFLAFILIFNTYLAEKKARRIEILRKEVVELHLNYISVKSDLMYLSNQSEISRRLKSKGFVESVVPPRVITEPKERPGFFMRLFIKKR